MASPDVTIDPHAAAQPAGDHDEGGHGHSDHGGGSGHDASHAQEPLGPIDWRAWGAGALGAVAAGVVAVALYLSSHPG